MAIRNNYSKRTPLFEKMVKDIACLFRETYFFILNGFSLPVWVAYPTYPSKKTTLFKIAIRHRVRLTNKLVKKPARVFYFEDETYGDPSELKKAYPNFEITNLNCSDISKTKVNEIHKQILGYDFHVDPTQFNGLAVEKSEVNALHDGKTIACPISLTAIKTESVYQIVIDNETEDGQFVDIRVPVVFGQIPLVYLKFKSAEKRFTNDMHAATLHETDDILTQEEQTQCIAFARAMGAQFCELDVLRHKGNGNIYIIDLNKTPYGPPSKLDSASKEIAILGISNSI